MSGLDSLSASMPASRASSNAFDPAVEICDSSKPRRKAVAETEGLKPLLITNAAPGTDDPTESGLSEHRQRLGPILAELTKRTKKLQIPTSVPAPRAAIVPLASSNSEPLPSPRGAGETAADAPGPNDWVAQSAAAQRSLAELAQKAALDTALLKLQNDLNDATVSVMKSMGSSIKSAAQ